MKAHYFWLSALCLAIFLAVGAFPQTGFSADGESFQSEPFQSDSFDDDPFDDDLGDDFKDESLGDDFKDEPLEDDLGDDFKDESLEDDLGDDFKDDLGDDFKDEALEDDLGDDFKDEPFEDDLGDDFKEALENPAFPGAPFEGDLGDDFQDEAGPSHGPGVKKSDPTIPGEKSVTQRPLEKSPAPSPAKKKPWISPGSIRGRLNLSSAWAISRSRPGAGETDWRGVSSLKSGVFLEFDMDIFDSWTVKVTGDIFYDGIYALNGRTRYVGDTLDHYEHGGEIREAFIQGRLSPRLDIKVGRQKVAWGKSDYIRVTDVLNPVNLREPGKTDLEDIRIPVFMTKLDYYWGAWNLSGIAIHERRLNKEPVHGSMFYAWPGAPLPEKTPSNRFSKTEYAAAASGSFSGMDVSFYYADYYEKTPYLVMTGPSVFEKRHSAVKMAGADFNLAKGSWLLKSEAAFFDGIRFSDRMNPATSAPLSLSGNSYSKANILAGLEYSGFSDATIAIETMNSHIIGFDDGLKSGGEKKNRLSTSIAATRSFFNDRLDASALATIYGENGGDGALFRLKGEYEWTDSVSVSGGAVFYESGDLSFFEKIGGNDMLFLDVQYSF